MIELFEQVALTEDLPTFNLFMGDVGTLVDITPNGKQYTVEFFNFVGKTIAVVPVLPHQIRPIQADEVVHTRPMKA